MATKFQCAKRMTKLPQKYHKWQGLNTNIHWFYDWGFQLKILKGLFDFIIFPKKFLLFSTLTTLWLQINEGESDLTYFFTTRRLLGDPPVKRIIVNFRVLSYNKIIVKKLTFFDLNSHNFHLRRTFLQLQFKEGNFPLKYLFKVHET